MAVRPFDSPPLGLRPVDGAHATPYSGPAPADSLGQRPLVSSIPWVDDPRCVDCVTAGSQKPAPKAKGGEVCIGHSRARAKRERLERERIEAEQAAAEAARVVVRETNSEIYGGPRAEDFSDFFEG